MKNNLSEEKTMKWYFKLVLTILLIIIYKPITYAVIRFFTTRELLPNSLAFGIVYWVILGLIFWFIVYKIWKMKRIKIPSFRENKTLYIVGIILISILIFYCVIEQNRLGKSRELATENYKNLYYNNSLNYITQSENSQIYSDSKITFSIPSELEQYDASFGSDNGTILFKYENNSEVISITIVSSSIDPDYLFAENCGSTTSCGHEKFTQYYFTINYKELLKLHPYLSEMSIKTLKDGFSLQNSYEKNVLINENIIFGTKVVFDTESEDITRILYSYSADLDNEFNNYMNTILESLKFN